MHHALHYATHCTTATSQVPLSKRRALLHVVLFDWDKVGTDEFLGASPNPNPNPNPNSNPKVGTDEFLGEALLGLDEYLDGTRHSLKLELDQLKVTLILTLTLTPNP